MKRFVFIVIATLTLAQTGTRAQVTPLSSNGIAVSTGGATDTLRLISYSNWQEALYAQTTSGSPVIYLPASGTGNLAVGMTVTGTALTGNTGTISNVSAQQSQIPGDGTTTGTTNNAAQITSIPAIDCARIKAYMSISDGGLANGFTALDVTPVYTTADCASGTVTTSAAATGGLINHTLLVFAPAIIMSVNADESHTTLADFATLTAKETVALTATYYIRTTAGTAVSNFVESSITSDRVKNTGTPSSTLTSGILQSGVVTVSSGNPDSGALFVQVQLIRSGTVYANLACGTVTQNRPLNFPGPCVESRSVSRQRTLAQPRPVTGAPIYIDVPANVSWELISIGTLFQTSATAGNRYPFIMLTDKEGIGSYTGLFIGNGILGPSSGPYLIRAGTDIDTPSVIAKQKLYAEKTFMVRNAVGASATATITHAAPADQGAAASPTKFRHVVDCIGGTVATSGTAGAVNVMSAVLISGASGGTSSINIPLATPTAAGNRTGFEVCGLHFMVAPTTAATLEMNAASQTNSLAAVWMGGWTELAYPPVYLAIPRVELFGGGKARIVLVGSDDNIQDDIWAEPQFKVVERWVI